MTPFRRAAALAAAATVLFAACGDDAAGTTQAPDSSVVLSDRAVAGRTVFEDNCTVCHGDGLAGGTGPALGRGSQAAERPLDALEATIRQGGNGMPSWGGLLEDSEISDVLAYLAEMQGR